MALVLEVDAGNTFLKWRLVDGSAICARGKMPSKEIDRIRFENELKQIPKKIHIANVASQSLLENILELASLWSSDVFVASVVEAGSGIKCGYDNPQILGIDRWLGLVAAFHKYRGACVVISLGTAVTVDLLNHSGEHLGGYIVPGLGLMRKVLADGTAHVKAEKLLVQDISPGANTDDAVNHGCLLMLKGLIKESFKLLAKEGVKPTVVMSGGDATLVLKILDVDAVVYPDLVLDGLAIVAKHREV